MTRIEQIMAKLPRGSSTLTNETHVHMFQEISDLVKPTNILEIGFYTGRSAALWLETSNANVVSCDVGLPWVSIEIIRSSLDTLNFYYPNRLIFLLKSSQSEEFREMMFNFNRKFDFCFIDGRHEDELPLFDLETALKLGCRYILIDDYECTNLAPWGVIKCCDKLVSAGRIEKVKEFNYYQPIDGNPNYVHVNKMVLFKNLEI